MSDTHVRVAKQGSRASVTQWPEFSIYVQILGSLLKPHSSEFMGKTFQAAQLTHEYYTPEVRGSSVWQISKKYFAGVIYDLCGIGKVWELLKCQNHFNKKLSLYQYYLSYKVSICGNVWILEKIFHFLLYKSHWISKHHISFIVLEIFANWNFAW